MILLISAGSFLAWSTHANEETIDADEVKAALVKSGDWHLKNPYWHVALRWWHMAPYYDGLLALSDVTGNPRYLSAVIAIGEQVGWCPADRVYHADDHAVGHAFLDIYQMDESRKDRLHEIKERMDYVIANPILEPLKIGRKENTRSMSDRWTWCDALYMAPPTLARLSAITGDQKYLRFMDLEYRYTYDELWDPEEKLFYRDSEYISKQNPNGNKIFWSRGNGWVYGGLALLMDYLPKGDLARPFYEKLYLEMTDGILRSQQPDGLWRPSLRDPDEVPIGESSGTGFFVYGLAWGINNGLLDKESYWPHVVRGWKGLMARVQPNGMVGYVQPVGSDPQNNVTADKTQVYGAGAFFLAGAEILEVLGADSDKPQSELYAEAQSLVENNFWKREVGGYVIPQRDDIAWENDRIAFRVYGPKLKSSVENSGVDVWTKRVEYPIIDKWYQKQFSGEGSYHEDTGEGYDGYKVGAARGCGGTGLVYNNKLYTANTYNVGNVLYDLDGIVRLRFDYTYDIDDKLIHERKYITLRKNEYLCEAESRFWGDTNLLDSVKFATGLTAQRDDANVRQERSILLMIDQLNDSDLWTAVRIVSGLDSETFTLNDQIGEKGDTLLVGSFEEGYTVRFLFGYNWEKHSGFRNEADWLAYVGGY